MDKKLDDYLVKKYPKIFADRNGRVTETAMCWGFEHGDGWFWLLDGLCDAVQGYIDGNNEYREDDKKIPQVVATQVKEKFGTLNFYYVGGDDTVRGMVRLAESMSAHVCERCGSTTEVGSTAGWIYTLCKECHSKDKRASVLKWTDNSAKV